MTCKCSIQLDAQEGICTTNDLTVQFLDGQWHLFFLTAYWHLGGGRGWDGKPTPKISETTGRMPMEFLPDFKYHREAQNPKNFEITHLDCKLWVSKIQKRSNNLFSGNTTSGILTSKNFAGLSILTTEINPENVLKISYFTEQSVKLCQILVYNIQNGLYKMRTWSRDYPKFTGQNLQGDVISSTSRHRPSFKSL